MASRKQGLGGEGSAPAPHVLAVDDSSVDRAVISSILRSSQFRGEKRIQHCWRVWRRMILPFRPSLLCRVPVSLLFAVT